MNLKKQLSDALGLQKASWIPYTGPYGGEGWMNPSTGEVRYQDEKPAPGEGEPEGEASEGTGESYQDAVGLDPEADAYETELGDFFEVGEQVQLKGELYGQDEPHPAEVTEVDEDGVVWVDDGTEEYHIVLDDLADESMEQVVGTPPDAGWESGWTEPPDAVGELVEGQTVEVYDTNAGEYVAGQVEAVNEDGDTASVDVQATDEWAPPEDANYEEGDSLHLSEESPFTVTATEDFVTTENARPIEYDEALNLSHGDEVFYDSHESGLSEAEVRGKTLDEDDNLQVELETEEGHLVETQVDEEWTSIYDEPVEWTEAEEVFGLDFENPEDSKWEVLDGQHVAVEHPVEGEVTGEAELYEGAEGWTWVSVGPPDDAEPMAVGDVEVAEGDPIELEVESSMPGGSTSEYEGVFAGLNDGPATGEYLMVDPDDEDHKMGFDAEDLAAVHADHSSEGPDVAVTTNPDHPYYVGETLTQSEDPWESLAEVDTDTDLKPGDTVAEADNEHTTEIEAIRNGQVKTQAGTWVDFEDFSNQVDAVHRQEDIAPSEVGLDDYDDWLDPWEGEDGGRPDFHPDDHVYYHDEDENEMKVGQVEEYDDGSEGIDPSVDQVTVDGTQVDREQIAGYADTGSVLAGMDTIDHEFVGDGELLTYYEESPYSDEPNRKQAYVLDANPSYHDNHLEVMGEQGNTFALYPEDEGYAVTDREQYPDTSEFFESGGDGMNTPTEELVDQFYGEVDTYGHDNYLSKVETFGDVLRAFLKAEQQSIKSQMMTHFDPAEVEGFYDAISNWKHDSGSDTINQKLESAFKEALDIESRVRFTNPDEEYPTQPPAEWVKMAEVASQMSQRYYDEVVRDHTDGQLTRDASSTAFRSFLLEWAENPDVDEFELDGRALNNFQTSPRKWNYWRVTPNDVPTENIGLMTDMMFNPMETNSGEDEIWVISDGLTASPRNVGVGSNRHHSTSAGADFGQPIEEWDETTAETIGREFAQHFSDLTEDETEVYRPDELSDQQVQTFQQYAEHAENLGLTKSNHKISEFAKRVTKEAQRRNLLDADTADLPTGVESIDDLREGMEITAWDGGEEIAGEVVSVQTSTGDLVIENVDTGKQMQADPSDIKDIHYSPEPYGPFDRHDPESFEGENFEPGTKAWFRPYSGGMEEVTVLDVQDDGTVKFNRPTGQPDFIHPQTDGRLVPQSADESEGSADAPESIDSMDDVELGDEVYVDSWDTTLEVTEVVQQPEDPAPTGFWVGDDEDPQQDILEPHQVSAPSAEADDGEWTPSDGEAVEIEVPDTVDYDAESITAPYVDDGDTTGVHYSDIPWLDDDDYGEEAVMTDLVNVDDHLAGPAEGSAEDEDAEPFDEAAGEAFLDDQGLSVGDPVEYGDEGEGEVVGATTMMQDGEPSHVEVDFDGNVVPLHPNSVDPVAGSDDEDILGQIEDEIDSIAPDDEPDEVLADEEDIEDEAEQLLDEIEQEEEPDFDSAALEAGDTITINNLGTEQEVEVLQPNLPGDAVSVAAPDSDGTMTVYESEIQGVAEASDDEPAEVPINEWESLDEGQAVELYEPSIDDSQGAEVVEVTETMGGHPVVIVETESGKTKTITYGDSTEIHT